MALKFDLTGQKFNKLTVQRLAYIHKKKRTAFWECECECGNISTVPGSELKSSRIKSCGCLRKETLSSKRPYNFKDISGQVFGLLTVLRVGEKTKTNNITMWVCQCKCGVIKNVNKSNLLSGRQTSCGCENRRKAKEGMTTHGLSKERIYRIWAGMISRCYNHKVEHYSDYGGRGIQVSDEWRNDFMNFYNDMMPTYDKLLTIDRIEVNGNYCKENCRWATMKEQSRNRRNSLYLTIDGETKHAKEWAEQYNKDYGKIHQKHRYGKNDKEAVFGRIKVPIDRMKLPKH